MPKWRSIVVLTFSETLGKTTVVYDDFQEITKFTDVPNLPEAISVATYVNNLNCSLLFIIMNSDIIGKNHSGLWMTTKAYLHFHKKGRVSVWWHQRWKLVQLFPFTKNQSFWKSVGALLRTSIFKILRSPRHFTGWTKHLLLF